MFRSVFGKSLVKLSKSSHKPAFSRRVLTRHGTSQDIWVCWQCNGREDFSRVLDINAQGLFLETSQAKISAGMTAKLDFLVEEGRIRAEAQVRHVEQGSGLGLKFTALRDPDSARLKSLIRRLRTS
jgi:hypothetical protein